MIQQGQVFKLRAKGADGQLIDRHYGHLARDSHIHAVSLLDALALERAVDAGWTPQRRGRVDLLNTSDSSTRRERSRRVVDARWTSRPETVARLANRKT